MATYTKYDTFIWNLANKLIDFSGATDVFKAIIHTDAPAPTTDNALTDFSQIGGSNGYTTGGDAITYTCSPAFAPGAGATGATATVAATDKVWTASGGNLGASTTGRYFTIYDSTSAGTNPICSFDYGGVFTVADTETMTLDFGVSLFTLT